MPHADLRRADEIFERLVIMHQLIEAITLHDNLLDDHPAQPGRAVEQFGDDYRPCFRRANRNFPSRSEDLRRSMRRMELSRLTWLVTCLLPERDKMSKILRHPLAMVVRCLVC